MARSTASARRLLVGGRVTRGPDGGQTGLLEQAVDLGHHGADRGQGGLGDGECGRAYLGPLGPGRAGPRPQVGPRGDDIVPIDRRRPERGQGVPRPVEVPP